jgi:hypothetical protein
MKKVLFVSYGGGHINIIDLIAEELLNEKNIEFKILALTTAYNKVIDKYSNRIVKRVSDYKHIFKNNLEKIEQYGLDILDENYNLSSGISKDETIMYLGCSMFDLVKQYGYKKAKERYSNKKRQAFLPIETMKKILQYEGIDIVVSTTAPRFEHASLVAGNELGLKTVEILDLFGDLHPLPEANYIVCMNESVKHTLRTKGLEDRNYYCLGQPAIEKSVNEICKIKKINILKKLVINKDKKVLLFATQKLIEFNNDLSKGNIVDNDSIYDSLFVLLDKIAMKFNIQILLRIHPGENKSFYDKYLLKYRSIIFINDKLNIYESIAISNFILTHSSTVGIEAVASHKTVFTYMHKYDIKYPILEMKMKPFVFSEDIQRLEQNLSKYLNNNINTIAKEFMPKDASKNIAKLIKEL